MTLKPTHLSAAVEALEAGNFADAKEAVKAVVATVDELRAKDVTFVVVRQYVSQVDGTATYMGYGPFPTKASALKAANQGRVGLAGFGTLAIVPLRSQQLVEAQLKSIDELPAHIGPNHWMRLKEKVG